MAFIKICGVAVYHDCPHLALSVAPVPFIFSPRFQASGAASTKLGKLISPSVAALKVPRKKIDLSSKATTIYAPPTGLGRPNYIAKHVVRTCK